VTSTTVDVTC